MQHNILKDDSDTYVKGTELYFERGDEKKTVIEIRQVDKEDYMEDEM